MGEGKDSHSRQWRLSMAVFLNRNKRPLAAPIEVAELLLEKPPPSHIPAIPASADAALPRMVAAALSAAVTSTKLIGDEPHSHGRSTPKEQTSLFPATLRERGSGGEALLLEKRPLPQNLPLRLFGREREGGGFSTEKPPPSQSLCTYYSLSSSSSSSSGKTGLPQAGQR